MTNKKYEGVKAKMYVGAVGKYVDVFRCANCGNFLAVADSRVKSAECLECEEENREDY